MAVAGDDPFIRGQIGRAHGAAGVELVGADPDLRAQPVLAAIGPKSVNENVNLNFIITATDPDGTTWELIASGFRNEFDASFNREGELFTFDADMEWDIGEPWYERPLETLAGYREGLETGQPDSLGQPSGHGHLVPARHGCR